MIFCYRCLKKCPWRTISAREYTFFLDCMVSHPELMEGVTIAMCVAP
jgi:hypothetical protein